MFKLVNWSYINSIALIFH